MLEILNYEYLSDYNIIKFMYMNRAGMFSYVYETDWKTNFEITNCASRNSHKYYIPMLRTSKLSKMPPFIYSKIWNSNESNINANDNIDFLSDTKDYFSQRQLLSNMCLKHDCFICNRIYTEKKNIREREKKY